MQKNSHKNQQQISKIEITNDKISGRGGFAFFLWRLQIEKTTFILLYVDTMVMDNNDSQK